MKIVVAGGSGFIGQPLVTHLEGAGHDVAVLTRNPATVRAGRALLWDGKSQGTWSDEVGSADAVVNLAGENIGDRRWTAKRKQDLISSRVDATHALVEAIRGAPPRERIFISASGANYYAAGLEQELGEDGPHGGGFLGELTARWEGEARRVEGAARLVILRFGVVIGAGGGALARMLLPFKLGVGGRIGSGEQWMSWIARDDVVRIIDWALTHPDASGVYNATAPQPVRNRDFTAAFARAIHRPAIIPIPGVALKAAFGQMAEETLMTGQRAVPVRATRAGFRFAHDTIDSALSRALRPR
ncbi:MAG TPA: TIGR01777 family oxidoreductase [Thermoanaerobaculia bacterium]|nr:TIGR01777 family oxidoreductase [Thermoanaerobaculia bacterium]